MSRGGRGGGLGGGGSGGDEEALGVGGALNCTLRWAMQFGLGSRA